MMVKPRPVSSAWMTYRTGATNKNKNSSGSVVPPHAGDDPGDQQAFNFMSVSGRAQWYRQRGSRQAAEECRHFTLRQETGGARRSRGSSDSSAAHGRWSAPLTLAADVESAAGFGKADQRHQNMVQAKRQQQSLAGAESSAVPGAVDHLPEGVDPHGEDWPHQRIASPTSPSTTVVTIGTKRVPPKKGRPAGECYGSVHAAARR